MPGRAPTPAGLRLLRVLRGPALDQRQARLFELAFARQFDGGLVVDVDQPQLDFAAQLALLVRAELQGLAAVPWPIEALAFVERDDDALGLRLGFLVGELNAVLGIELELIAVDHLVEDHAGQPVIVVLVRARSDADVPHDVLALPRAESET